MKLEPLSDELFLLATDERGYMSIDEMVALLDAAGYWPAPAPVKEKQGHVKAKLQTFVNERGFPLFSVCGRGRTFRAAQYLR